MSPLLIVFIVLASMSICAACGFFLWHRMRHRFTDSKPRARVGEEETRHTSRVLTGPTTCLRSNARAICHRACEVTTHCGKRGTKKRVVIGAQHTPNIPHERIMSHDSLSWDAMVVNPGHGQARQHGTVRRSVALCQMPVARPSYGTVVTDERQECEECSFHRRRRQEQIEMNGDVIRMRTPWRE